MGHSAMWILVAQISLLFCLVHTEEEIPLASEFDMYQREIIPSFPIKDVQLPLLIHGESVLSPRGRRPAPPASNNLKDFPPGRPSQANINNICGTNRVKASYGPHNMPQTGFAHLARQGRAINKLEEGFTKCCRRPNKLRCSEDMWKSSLEKFCSEEFSVKTRHYHCCKKQGFEREDCFMTEAPNPSYDTPISMMQEASVVSNIGNLGALPDAKPCPTCQDRDKSGYKVTDLAFPPGKPRSSNIQNVCKLGKYRLHTDKMLSQSGFKYTARENRAINRVEREYRKCCKTNDVACAQTGWEKVLSKFCVEEAEGKNVPHVCCNRQDQVLMHRCFANEAPFPEYDRGVQMLDLSAVTEDVLEKLCGEFKLLTKKKHLPLLVSDLKDSCCTLTQDQKLECAEQQKMKHIKTLCGSKKESWKDHQNCCEKSEAERDECFAQYLQSIAVAVMESKELE